MEKKKPAAGVRIEIDGLACEVGVMPASGTTTGELADRLAHYPRETPVGFSVGLGSNLELLSLYQASETGAVWLDLGEPDADH